MSILDHFPPGMTPRRQQAEALIAIEANWNSYAVFSVVLPTGVGKTEVAVTIANWQAARGIKANILQPNNVLVEQIQRRYPHLQALHRKDSYQCSKMDISCSSMISRKIGHCQDCVYRTARRDTIDSHTRLLNYYTYWSHKLYAPVAIFDEAHQVVDMLQSRQDIRLWQSQFKFPNTFKTVADVVVWGQRFLRISQSDPLKRALREIMRLPDGATIEYRHDKLRGHSDTVLHVIPNTSASAPPWLWPPAKVEKIVLLSATMSAWDVREMGLTNRRVLYLRTDSPIPPESRPVLYQPACNMGHRHINAALPILAERIKSTLAAEPGKGLIHLPYGLAMELRGLLNDPRLIFHRRDNKSDMLAEFRDSPPKQGRVLVASGLYEGIDLPYDAARWQIIGKVPFLSFGSLYVKQKAEQNPDWYTWEAVKRVLQASGRIVRAADDFGRTYIFDTQFGRLLEQDIKRPDRMFPDYYRSAIKLVRK